NYDWIDVRWASRELPITAGSAEDQERVASEIAPLSALVALRGGAKTQPTPAEEAARRDVAGESALALRAALEPVRDATRTLRPKSVDAAGADLGKLAAFASEGASDAERAPIDALVALQAAITRVADALDAARAAAAAAGAATTSDAASRLLAD